MANQDLIALYSGRILELAGDIPHCTRLEAPTHSATVRSPLCGSTITVDLVIADGQITQFGQDIKACALGQAAASVIARAIIGQTRTSVAHGREQLHAMLTAAGPVPDAPWDGLEVMQPAAEYRNRHASILLCFDAVLQAWPA